MVSLTLGRKERNIREACFGHSTSSKRIRSNVHNTLKVTTLTKNVDHWMLRALRNKSKCLSLLSRKNIAGAQKAWAYAAIST